MGIPSSSTGPRRQVISEACAWFIEFRTAEATAGIRERFDEWLRHSPEHIQAYLEVAAAWAELPTQDAAARIDIDALVQRARTSRDDDVVVPISARATPTDPPRRTPRFLAPRALAAGITAALIVAGTVGWWNWRQAETYTTDIGEQRTIRLADDSVVDLNARSSIRVRFSKSERTVELTRGQALFHVARDASRPFTVRSDTTAVRAVGTQFDVYRKGRDLVVTVVEGRVAVIPQRTDSDDAPAVTPVDAPSLPTVSVGVSAKRQRAGTSVLLSAGEQLTVTPVAAAIPHTADVSAATAWVQRRLVFEDTPLAEVAEEFNRYSMRPLVIDDAELAHESISGIYSSSDPTSLIGFLRAQPMLQVEETDREIRVTRRSP